jgi:hypothetical protein
MLAATLFAVSFFVSKEANAQVQSPFIIHNPEFRIKSLPPDNMPCLIPNMTALEKMPIHRMPGLSPMPNPLYKTPFNANPRQRWSYPRIIPMPRK